MRLTDLTERSRQGVTLFRGDSSLVDEFDMDKTDAQALVGRGIYLTTSFDVAKDYTIKGADVLYRSEEGETDPRGFIYDTFYDKLLPHVSEVFRAAGYAIQAEASNMDRIFSDEIDATVGTGREAYNHPRFNELNNWRNAAHRYVMPYAAAASEKIITEFVRKIYDAEYKKFKETFKGTRMLTTVLGELVILPEDKLGQVSRFRAPQSYLDSKFYQVDEPMSDQDLMWVVQQIGNGREDFDRSSSPVALRYNDDNGEEVGYSDSFDQWIEKFKTNGARYAWGDYNIGGKGKNPTLMQFAVGTHQGQSMTAGFGSTFWDDFRDHLIQMGYKGIHYAGGTRTGTNTFSGGSPVKHDVYVLWDQKEANALRVGTKEVGVAGTDKNLFSRFRFSYVIKNMVTNPLRRYKDDAKRMRKDIKNVERIEAAVHEWLKTGELQQAMEKAYASIKDT